MSNWHSWKKRHLAWKSKSVSNYWKQKPLKPLKPLKVFHNQEGKTIYQLSTQPIIRQRISVSLSLSLKSQTLEIYVYADMLSLLVGPKGDATHKYSCMLCERTTEIQLVYINFASQKLAQFTSLGLKNENFRAWNSHPRHNFQFYDYLNLFVYSPAAVGWTNKLGTER
jgi:hypothetical protein